MQYVDMNIAHATLVAIRAYGRPPVIATQLGREALSIHPWCPEAYNVLATHAAQNLQEALDYYLEVGCLVAHPFVALHEV
jgi:hypothetical protein